MTSLRAAVLIFLVGASMANFFATKERIDYLESPVPAPTAMPSASVDNSSDPYERMADQTMREVNAQGYKDEVKAHAAAVAWHAKQMSQIHDQAWMREAIIVTVAGVAWFALLSKAIAPPSS